MIFRPERHRLLPLPALGTTLANAASAHAQGSVGTSATLQIHFGSTPHWASISGSRDDELPAAERPDYDMFRFDGAYYACNTNRWYTARLETGGFTAVDDRSVSSELSRGPRGPRRNHTSRWLDRSDARRYGRPSSDRGQS